MLIFFLKIKTDKISYLVLETSEESVEIEVPFKVGMWDLKQCDPKRCTGRKLMRLEMIDKLGMSAMFNGIVLTPVATEVR